MQTKINIEKTDQEANISHVSKVGSEVFYSFFKINIYVDENYKPFLILRGKRAVPRIFIYLF